MFIRNHYRQGQVFLGAAQCHHTVAVYGIVQLLPIHDRHRWGKAFCQTNGTKVCRFTAIIAQLGLGTGFTGSICQCLHFRIDKVFFGIEHTVHIAAQGVELNPEYTVIFRCLLERIIRADQVVLYHCIGRCDCKQITPAFAASFHTAFRREILRFLFQAAAIHVCQLFRKCIQTTGIFHAAHLILRSHKNLACIVIQFCHIQVALNGNDRRDYQACQNGHDCCCNHGFHQCKAKLLVSYFF